MIFSAATRARFQRIGDHEPQGLMISFFFFVKLRGSAFGGTAPFVALRFSFPFKSAASSAAFRLLIPPFDAFLQLFQVRCVRQSAFVSLHYQLPIMDELPGPSFRNSTFSRLAYVGLLGSPHIDGGHLWSSLVRPDWFPAKARHDRPSKRGDGGGVGCGTKGLPEGRRKTVPRDGVSSH